MANQITVGVHCHSDADFSAHWSWSQILNGRTVSAVEIEGVSIFFQSVTQIERLEAVLAEAKDKLLALMPTPVTPVAIPNETEQAQ